MKRAGNKKGAERLFFIFGIMRLQVVGGFLAGTPERGKAMLEFISVVVTVISIIVTVIGIYEAKKQNKPPLDR